VVKSKTFNETCAGWKAEISHSANFSLSNHNDPRFIKSDKESIATLFAYAGAAFKKEHVC